MTAGVGDRVLRLADGRALGFRIYGDAEGRPLLFLHGTPGSRLKFVIGHEAGQELGLALVAPDRWGYGLSDVPAEPSLPAFAGDMAALMDHLGHRRFHVMGGCIGGTFCLTLCEMAPERVTAAVLQNPIGLHENRDTWDEAVTGFAKTMLARDSTLTEDVIKKFGAEVLRLWVAAQGLHGAADQVANSDGGPEGTEAHGQACAEELHSVVSDRERRRLLSGEARRVDGRWNKC